MNQCYHTKYQLVFTTLDIYYTQLLHQFKFAKSGILLDFIFYCTQNQLHSVSSGWYRLYRIGYFCINSFMKPNIFQLLWSLVSVRNSSLNIEWNGLSFQGQCSDWKQPTYSSQLVSNFGSFLNFWIDISWIRFL